MIMRLADYCESKGETDKARRQLESALRVIESLKPDDLLCSTEPCFYDYYGKAAADKANRRIADLLQK